MRTKIMSLLFILFFASVAGAAPSTRSPAVHFKQCHSVECRVPAGEMAPPDGARLSFSQCDDGVKEDYVFELTQGFWRVVSYATSKVPSCDDADGA